MTLTQLEYLVALDTHRHFGQAAAACHVTQPTLSMQLQKLEEELGVVLFLRNSKPVVPTEIGAEIIQQARIALREVSVIPQLIHDRRNTLSGEIRVGIIPTLAPYLIPPVFRFMREQFPQLQLFFKEVLTQDILTEVKLGRLDCGIVVTPLNEPGIREETLFYEELFVYAGGHHPLVHKKSVKPEDLNSDDLWLLEEGHCFRSQVLNLCDLRSQRGLSMRYETGNIESLKRMVDSNDGFTILPELSMRDCTVAQASRIKRINHPVPVREVSVVTRVHELKTKLIDALKSAVMESVPQHMRRLEMRNVVEIM